MAADWQPRGWQWIDPQKEISANIEAVKNGFKSVSDVLSESGRDPLDTLSQLAAEKELADAMGLNLQLGDATERPAESES